VNILRLFQNNIATSRCLNKLNLPALIMLFILFHSSTGAQSLADLQQKKESAAREIEITTRLLSQVQQQEKASLNRLQLINNNINQRNQLIAGLAAEIKLYREFIRNNQLVIELVTGDLEQMKEEYARLIRLTYASHNSGNPLLFLLSADNFNQAYRRLLYMKRYASVRTRQAEAMKQLQLLLDEKIVKLEEQTETSKQLLAESQEEAKKLSLEKKQQNQEVQKLKNQQRDLRQKLEQQRKD
jgi:murein hydrolase activator